MIELPYTFLQSIQCCQGYDEASFISSHETTAPTSIRVNPFKPSTLAFPLSEPVLWNKHGFYLIDRPNFTHDILFQAGCYYVQEAGSMFIETALTQSVDFTEQLVGLDLCASPGGKSTLINSLLNNESVLVANEISKQRADVLSQNLSKWGTSNVIVTNNDPVVFSEMQDVFDFILVDAPCSGSGLFRKQADAVNEWSLENVNLCSSRQKRILSEVMNSLKKDGVLVYSTCSYSEEENEDIVDWLLAEFDLESIKLSIDDHWGITETYSKHKKGFGYRFYPNKTKSEGFFCTVFRKKNGNDNSRHKKLKHQSFLPVKVNERELFNPWILATNSEAIIKFKDDYLLTNFLAVDFLNRNSHLYFKKVGTNIGTLVRNELVPHHDLAWSIYLRNDVKQIECSDLEALQYLKKELQSINGESGWNLISYEGMGLGWIKHLGNRINNYLPNEYRILK
jgi:NOL1/NOP2/sun family putative RNA methylase